MSFSSFLRALVGVSVLLVLGLMSACSNNDDGGTTGPPGLELNSNQLAGSGAGVYSHTFASIGTFPYHCKNHGGMRDTIRVTASSPNTSVAISITGNAFDPPGSTVQPGGTVTWTNNDGPPHTVTSD